MKRQLLAFGLCLCSGLALATININTATRDELVALPGIGPAKAQAILDHRKAHGPFKSIEGLKDVKGIGAKRFEKLKPELAVTGPNSTKSATKPDGKGDTSAQRTVRGEMPAVIPARRDAANGAIKP
jgi:competence protein ComEA